MQADRLHTWNPRVLFTRAGQPFALPLAGEVAESLIAKHHRPSLITSFFQHAGLEL
jgi:hypothetical protein